MWMQSLDVLPEVQSVDAWQLISGRRRHVFRVGRVVVPPGTRDLPDLDVVRFQSGMQSDVVVSTQQTESKLNNYSHAQYEVYAWAAWRFQLSKRRLQCQ